MGRKEIAEKLATYPTSDDTNETCSAYVKPLVDIIVDLTERLERLERTPQVVNQGGTGEGVMHTSDVERVVRVVRGST